MRAGPATVSEGRPLAGEQADRLRRRTLSAFAIILAAFLGVGVAVSGSLVALNRMNSRVLETYGQSLRLLLEIRRNREAMKGLADEVVRSGPRADSERRLEGLEAALTDESDRFERLAGDPIQRSSWDEEAADRRAFGEWVHEAVASAAAGRAGEAREALGRAATVDRRIDLASDRLVRTDARRARLLADSLDRRLDWTLALNLVAVLLGSLAAAALLRDALKALHDYFGEMQRRLEDLDIFAARVAHDLRQPLNSLSLLIGMAARSAADERLRLSLSGGLQTIERLNALIEDLLAFSRAGLDSRAAGASAVEPIVTEIVSELARREGGSDVDWRLEIEPGATVAVDPGNLRSIAWNLLENAVKYLPPEGERRISVSVSRDLANVRVLVRDTGPGIPTEALGSIFEPFRRATAAGTGHGLGLATVKRLVEAHGGRISVQSAAGRGAAFTIDLPGANP